MTHTNQDDCITLSLDTDHDLRLNNSNTRWKWQCQCNTSWPAFCSSRAMTLAVRAASRYCFRAMYRRNRYLGS